MLGGELRTGGGWLGGGLLPPGRAQAGTAVSPLGGSGGHGILEVAKVWTMPAESMRAVVVQRMIDSVGKEVLGGEGQ